MKVCDIVQFYSPLSGGIRRYVDDKARYLTRRLDTEHVMIIPASENFRTLRGGSTVHGIKSLPIPGSMSYRFLTSRRRIVDIVDAEAPDIIETGDPYWASWCAVDCAERLDIPAVAFYHSDHPRAIAQSLQKHVGAPIDLLLSRSIDRYLLGLYSRMDATIVATRRLHSVLTGMGIPNVFNVPLGTDTDLFHFTDSRARIFMELGIPSRATLLLHVGRLAREKNITSLLAMMDHLGPSSNFHLLFIGDGEQRHLVQESARCNSSISWTPHCSNTPLLAECYSAADLLVHAGTSETFGLVSIEAQACGTRVLAVRGGGLDETLEGEDPLIMAKSPAPADLAEAVHAACRPPNTMEDRLNRRQRIIRRFSLHESFTRLIELYEELCRRRQTERILQAVENEHALCHSPL